jgi:lysophospholipase L1-like esterase
MLDCLILGDSIAVGTAQFKPECTTIAKVGINSHQYYQQYVLPRQTDFGSEVVIISLGSNDWEGIKTYNELYKLRERVKAERVYWVLPNYERFPKQAEDVKLIALSFGDFVIKPTRYQEDRVHPSWAGYKEIAKEAE